jgi:hypothetical protein
MLAPGMIGGQSKVYVEVFGLAVLLVLIWPCYKRHLKTLNAKEAL